MVILSWTSLYDSPDSGAGGGLMIVAVPGIMIVGMLVLGFYRAKRLGMRWRDTGWPYLTVAAALYLISALLQRA